MTTIIKNNEIYSKVIQAKSMFVNTLLLRGFEHMEEVLGENCCAVELPMDILLWYSTSYKSEFDHSVTIIHKEVKNHLYGNVIITSNDADGINGIRDLSANQMKWLRENTFLIESELHKNYVLVFKGK